ncbi:cysteine hydrolase family protein [Streptomyces sp. NPDC057509]|uniref:cysteine hydrolase family protein n=1 Tax=Streptomyces sp. NPDC057509 TaxID=3346152 RepID=UPI003675AD11
MNTERTTVPDSRDGTTTRTALVVVDMQNDFCDPSGVFARAGLRVDALDTLIAHINTLIAAARAAGQPVIWVRMEWADDAAVGLLAQRSPFLRTEGLREGTWGAAVVPGLDQLPDDTVVVKARFSAFHRTALADVLERLGVGTVVVAGVRTDFCIESTVRDAFFRDLHAIVPEEAVAGYFEELHHNSLRLMGTVFAEVVPLEAAAGAFAPAAVESGLRCP